MKRYTCGMTPDKVIKEAANEQCPNGYRMVIRDRDEWAVIAEAWNQGIDAHLEALTERSSANPETGEVWVHPDELHVLLRRLNEMDSEEAHDLRGCVLMTLGIEEI